MKLVHTTSARTPVFRQKDMLDPYIKVMAMITMGFTTFACARYIDATPINPSYVRVDGNDDTYVASKKIRWIQKYKDSFYVCTNVNGCQVDYEGDKWKISASDNPEAYKQIEHMFGPE